MDRKRENSLKIGLIHLAVSHKQPDRNREILLKFLDEAITHGAKIIVAPELALSGYSFRNRGDIMPYTESRNGSTILELSKVARKSSVYICIGMAERDDRTGIIYNSAFVVGPEGGVVCHYRKVSAESRWACAGNSHQDNTFETPWGRVGVLICSDSYYALMPRITAIRGADLIIIIANWPPSGGLDPRELWRVRAIENGVFIVACNRAGLDLTMNCFEAPSCVYDPLGNVIFEGVSKDSQLFLVDIPLDSCGKLDNRFRKEKLSKRRVEFYRDCALNLWPVRDLTSFLGLPATGTLSVVCHVPKGGEHPVEMIKRLLAKGQFRKGSLCIIPSFRTSDVLIESVRVSAKAAEVGILWRDSSDHDFRGYLALWDGQVKKWCGDFVTSDEEAPFPEFDFGPARIAFSPFDLIAHPEFSLALAKRGCDIAVASEEFLDREWKLIGGARTIENIAVAVCGLSGAGIWTTPQGHERWGEVLANEGEFCALDLDTSITRNKRFQDRVNFELLLREDDLDDS